MTDLMPFVYGEFNLRTVLINGEPWFVLADACKVLDHSNPTMAAQSLSPDDLSTTEVIDSLGRSQVARIVNESGLYELIFQSRKPEAKAFRRWVTTEVLPAIRRTGTYNAAPLELDLENKKHLALIVTAANAALIGLQEAEAKVAELTPSAEAWDSLAAERDDFSVREAAQVLSRDDGISIGQNRLFGYLREIRWIDQSNAPYQSQVDNGRLVRRITDHTNDYGQRFVKIQPRITVKGIAELRSRLRPAGPTGLVAIS